MTTNYRERAAELLKQVSEEINEELHDFSRDGDDEPFTTADLDKIWIDAIASLLQQVAEESAPKWIPWPFGDCFELDIKRFYVPEVRQQKVTCAKCGHSQIPFSDYISYPTIGAATTATFYCGECDTETEFEYLLTIELQVRQLPAAPK